jgi:hypothetical protein
MLPAHARVLADARSCLAALADTAGTFDAALGYDRVLLDLDAIHGDDTPALHQLAETSLTGFGVDALRVELLLAALADARAADTP